MRNDENRPIDNPDNRNEELSWNDPKHPRYGEHKDKLSYDPKLGYQEPANSPSIAEDANTGDHTPIRTNPAGESMDNDPVHQSQGKELDDYEILKEGPDSTVPGSDRTLSDSILDGPETGGVHRDVDREARHDYDHEGNPDHIHAEPLDLDREFYEEGINPEGNQGIQDVVYNPTGNHGSREVGMEPEEFDTQHEDRNEQDKNFGTHAPVMEPRVTEEVEEADYNPDGSQEAKEEESERAFNEQAREVELDTATYPSAQAANDTNVVKKASPEGPLHLEEEQEAREGGFAEDPQGLNHTGVDYGVQESDYGDEEEPTVNLHQELADAEKRLRDEE